MLKHGLILLLLFFTSANLLIAQDKKTTAEEYISTYKDLAIAEMKRTGIPASITLAQGLLESGNGNSYLAKEANNHFGIKCKSSWTGKSVTVDDDTRQECFRAYDKAEESYKDHSDFLMVNTRYAFLFKLDAKDYKGWAQGLKQAGYATNPKYPDMIIGVIEKYHLDDYDAGNKINKEFIAQKNDEPKKNIFGKTISAPKNTIYNGIPAYEIKPDDTYGTIADAHQMMRWEIRKYNDLKRNEPLQPGILVYLKPKRRKAHEAYHTVKDGEGMYYISQYHGIKLRLLYKWNRMEKGQEPVSGEVLNLRFRREEPPHLKPEGTIIERKGIMLAPEKNTIKKDNIKVLNQPVDSGKNIIRKTGKSDSLHKNQFLGGYGHDENGNLFIFHIVQDGETIISISQKYKVADTLLSRWNNLTGPVKTGDKIFLTKPAEKMKPEPEKDEEDSDQTADQTDQTDIDYYTVLKGETLYGISKKFSVPVDSIIKFNRLKNNALYPGQKLRIKNPVEQQIQNTIEYHTVMTGETLYSISKKYGITIHDLLKMNGLKDNAISIGQKLKIHD